jgi:hypothetical protein
MEKSEDRPGALGTGAASGEVYLAQRDPTARSG